MEGVSVEAILMNEDLTGKSCCREIFGTLNLRDGRGFIYSCVWERRGEVGSLKPA